MPRAKQKELGGTYILRGGLLVDPVSESQESADLLVAGGRVEAIGHGLEVPEGAAEFDVGGALVCPGLIDIHAHLREPGREDKETIEDVYEPYLLQEGLIERTPRGRIATRTAYQHLGITIPQGLF